MDLQLSSPALASSSTPTSDIFGISPDEAMLATEYVEAGVTGFYEGVFASVAIGFALGVIAAFSAPVAIAVGLTLLALGALEVYDAYEDGSLGAGWDRLAAGRPSPSDVHVLSSLGGGLIGGGLYGRGAFAGGLGVGTAARIGGRSARTVFFGGGGWRMGRFFNDPGNGDVLGIFEPLEEVPHGMRLMDIWARMLEIQSETGLEVGLVRMRDGRRMIGAGGPDGVHYPTATVQRLIAHTHDTLTRDHLFGPSPEDMAGLLEMGQRSGYVIFFDLAGRVQPRFRSTRNLGSLRTVFVGTRDAECEMTHTESAVAYTSPFPPRDAGAPGA